MSENNGAIRDREKIRNIAIIAHVDHGKTTLVDKMLEQSGSFQRGEGNTACALDSNDLERERGITILSKCTSFEIDGYHINVVDTPGHADFGGEVERVMRMVDSVLILVDAFEGPMPQTRFVLQKALTRGLNPIVVINKVDREGADPDRSVNEVFDLFVSLDATDEQLDFPIVYTSAKLGTATLDMDKPNADLKPLIDTIIKFVPSPNLEDNVSPAFQVATFDHDNFLGSLAIGRMESGRFTKNEKVCIVHRDGTSEDFRITKILGFRGLHRFEMEETVAGDIVGITGMSELNVGETITSIENPRVLPLLKVDAPTVSMAFMANTSPTAGNEGKYVTSQNLRDRLFKEIKSNVSLRVETTDQSDVFTVSGRGELHLSVLIETMRREGYEFMVSQPRVVTQEDENGKTLEPYEALTADVETEHTGVVIDALNRRFGRLKNMREMRGGRTRIDFIIPTRGLIGYRSQFMTDTRGTGILNHVFLEYGPWAGDIKGRANGAIIAQDPCTAVTFALWNLQDRGTFFITKGDKVYAGQVIGIHNKDKDLVVNPGKAKKLTNLRASAADEKNFLKPHRIFTIEEAIEFINEDELVEFTPQSIRLRKRYLDHNKRKQLGRGKEE